VCAFEKSIVPNFSTYDVEIRNSAQNSSAANGYSQPQPLYGMPMNSYAGQPQPPPPIWGKPTNLHTNGSSRTELVPFGPAVVGYFCDEPPRSTSGPLYSAQGLTDTLRPSVYHAKPSEYTLRPSVYHTGPSGTWYTEHDVGYYQQYLLPPQPSFPLPPTAPQNHGMVPRTRRVSTFWPLKCRKDLTYMIRHLERVLMTHRTPTLGQRDM
jgi:hypothetical protein